MSKLKEFLAQHNLTQSDFDITKLNWDDLIKIKTDYISIKSKLEPAAEHISKILHSSKEVHSIRFRLKDPDSLIAKIIRKKIADPSRDINLDNYKTEITDLIGVRALHLFKTDWKAVNEFIIENFSLTDEKPIAYHRVGDTEETIKFFIEAGCDAKPHDRGYRSVHYLIHPPMSKPLCSAEIQVRTIFEEAWSEIDHLVSYPNNLDNILLRDALGVLNRFSGFSDEMGTYIQHLEKGLNEVVVQRDEKISELNNIIKSLKKEIEASKIPPAAQQHFVGKIDDFERASLGIINYNLKAGLSSAGPFFVSTPGLYIGNAESSGKASQGLYASGAIAPQNTLQGLDTAYSTKVLGVLPTDFGLGSQKNNIL